MDKSAGNVVSDFAPLLLITSHAITNITNHFIISFAFLDDLLLAIERQHITGRLNLDPACLVHFGVVVRTSPGAILRAGRSQTDLMNAAHQAYT